MISGGFGVPGSGKSLWLGYLAKRALAGKPLNAGRYSLQSKPGMKYDRVYTNFAFPGAYILDFDTLGHCDYHDCCMLIDEIMMYADSRDFKTFSKELKWFFSQHRKQNIDIVWISQQYDDVDKKIRGLTQNYYYIRQSFIPGFSEILPIEAFFDIPSTRIESGQQFSRIIDRGFFFRPSLYKLINSYECIGHWPSDPAPSDMW